MPPQAPEGYTLIYNNTTRGGMSGGPILDESGAIVGIHGKGNPSGGIKENYGIPIERYLQYRATEREGLRFPFVFSLLVGGGAALLLYVGSLLNSSNLRDSLTRPLPIVFSLLVGGGTALLFQRMQPVIFQSVSNLPVKEEIPEKPVEPPPTTPPSTPRSQPPEPSNPVEQPRKTQPISDRDQVPAKYHKLRDLLKAGEWEKADIETTRVMLQVADREKERWFRVDDIKNFPCQDLLAIDKLWVKYSDGPFGFSVQKGCISLLESSPRRRALFV
ncbi:MAG: GUN4 domain-containing protein [Hormoscilla sp. GUM202]|nr:GUN4 domain-containing protein [Hormoscilla sp. GUM202]